MKTRLVTILFTLLACVPLLQASVVESGVSRQLALQRKACISDIVYNLKLRIDSLQDVAPYGNIEIRFDYRPDGEPLQLDFTGEELKGMEVNGRVVSNPEWIEGHILVNPDLLLAGDNTIVIDFTAADRALNRNPDYLYTLFVPFRAHSVFPCFDQPDMKAVYRLTLDVPCHWKAVSNSPVVSESEDNGKGEREIQFGSTEPLSIYLFAFAAGDFDYSSYKHGNREIGAYYRETDPSRIAQLDEIFSQVENSLDILEEYTGIPYPFAKYDLVILPGFQFGGMEHTGATFYNDNALFLNENPTGADLLRRAMIIAHETSHLWFGDYVTMEWFDEVWTKEVFANYFAALLSRDLLPEYDHDLEWLRVYMSASLDQDRTSGTTPILQQLDNLKDAGLIYNNVIYNKSPLMLGKLVEISGEVGFREGVRKFLSDHPYGNATWSDFVSALSAYTDAPVKEFSRVWVNEGGMPHTSFSLDNGTLVARQTDPAGRGIVWPQTFAVLVGDKDDYDYVTVSFDGTENTVSVATGLANPVSLIIPSADGRAYGLLTVDGEILGMLMEEYLDPKGLCSRLTPTGKLATLIMLNENYLAGNIPAAEWLGFLIHAIENTVDTQMLSALTRYLGPSLLDLPAEVAAPYEKTLLSLVETHQSKQGRLLVLRSLVPFVRSSDSFAALYEIWRNGKTELIPEDDITDISLYLSVALPEQSVYIVSTQRKRIESPDRLRKFDYVSRAVESDTTRLDRLFHSLSEPENRLVEPWTLNVLSLLNHPLRQARSIRYIRPALELLPQIQQTGDIFFPANWANVLLANYRSPEAAALVRRFLEDNGEMNPLLLNKVRQSAFRLLAPLTSSLPSVR